MNYDIIKRVNLNIDLNPPLNNATVPVFHHCPQPNVKIQYEDSVSIH